MQQALAQAPTEPPTDIQGPTYPFEKIRNKEIAGIRLSMTPEEAIASLRASGWSGYVEEDHAYLTMGIESMWLQFPRIGDRRRLTYFSYERKLSVAEWADVAQRRREVIDLLGAPTIWTRWVRADDVLATTVIGDRYYFAPEHNEEAREEARDCIFDWQCKAIEANKDCRPAVRRLRGGTMEAGFGYRHFHVTVTDDELNAAELFQDRIFRERDMSKAVCFHPSVH